MKKLLSIFMILFALTILVSCKNNTNPSTSDLNPSTDLNPSSKDLAQKEVFKTDKDGYYHLSSLEYINDINMVEVTPKTGTSSYHYKYNKEFFKELLKFLDKDYFLLLDDPAYDDVRDFYKDSDPRKGYIFRFYLPGSSKEKPYWGAYFCATVYSNGNVYFTLNRVDIENKKAIEVFPYGYLSASKIDIEGLNQFMNYEELQKYKFVVE